MRYVIIGASAAGISCARNLRKLDREGDITLISKDQMVYSRCMLHLFISGDRSLDEMTFVEDDFFERNRIQWIKGTEIVKVQPYRKCVITSDGREYTYDKLLIATGSTPVVPPLEGLHEGMQKGTYIFTLKNIGDAQRIKEASKACKRAVVIGGGLIGLDVAVSLNRRGVKATVVEMKEHILPQQLDQKAAENYQKLFKEKGIEIMTGKAISKIIYSATGDVKAVALSDGSTIDADMIIVAVGVKPSFPEVEGGQLKTQKGILVDEHQRSSIEDVYAAGDVCQSYEMFIRQYTLTPIWPVAVRQGEVAAYNMVGINKVIEDNFAFKNSMKFFGLPTISYGYAEPPDSSYDVEVCDGPGYYYKVVYKGNIIYGAIIQGDIAGAGVLGKLIQNRCDLSRKLQRGRWDSVFSLTYGDFFSESEDGAFHFVG